MALVLVRLKLALLRAALARADIRGTVGFVFAGVLAAAFGVLGGFLLALLRFVNDDAATTATTAAFAIVLLIWTLGPVVTLGSDGTLPPERLASFPLTARQLMPGLLLASICGFGGLATVFTLAGAVVGLASGPVTLVVIALAAGAELAICVVASRLLGTLLSGAARTRRWRDVALLIGPLAGLAINLGGQVVARSAFPTGAGPSGSRAWDVTRLVLQVLPSGPPALAAGYARSGHLGRAFVALLSSAALVALGMFAWHRALVKTMTSGGVGSSDTARRQTSLFPWFARFLPRNRLGAVAARELRLSWRDPRQRAALFGGLFAPAILMLSLRTVSSTAPSIVLFAAAPAYFLGAGATNMFGYDGRAVTSNAAAPGDPAHDLWGKIVARAITSALVTAVALPVVVWRAGTAERAIDALALALATFAFSTGGAAVFSVRSPVAMPDSSTNVFSVGSAGQGLAAAGSALILMFVSAVLFVPIIVALVLADALGVRVAVDLLALAVGAASLAFGTRYASQHIRAHLPELIAAVGYAPST